MNDPIDKVLTKLEKLKLNQKQLHEVDGISFNNMKSTIEKINMLEKLFIQYKPKGETHGQ